VIQFDDLKMQVHTYHGNHKPTMKMQFSSAIDALFKVPIFNIA